MHIPNGLGDLLSGIAAVSATIGAFVGFRQWKVQKRIELQANAAAQSLVAVSELCARLHRVAAEEDPYIREHEASASSDQEFYVSWQEILADKETRMRFSNARVQGEIYLSDEANKALEGVWALVVETDMQLDAAITKCMGDQYGCLKPDDPILDSVTGAKMHERIDAAHSAAKRLLKPMATYQGA